MRDIEYYKQMAFDPRQMQVIRDGLKAGFDVEWYANTSFDYLQMEEILLALKAGLDDDSMNMLCDPRIPYESMRQMRESIFDQLGIYEKAAEELKRKKLIRYFVVSVSVFVIVIIGSIIYINRHTISYYFEDINLELKDDHIKLGLSEPFVAGNYFDKYDKELKLTLPKEKKFNEIGTYKVSYKLSNKVKTVTRELIIDVYDDINPTIELNSSIIEVEYGAVINEYSYVVKVHDNIDGDLSKELIIENAVDTSKAGNYTIKYCVKDNAGNEATAEITVIVQEKPVQEIPVKDNEKNNADSGSTSSKKSSAGKKVSNAGIYNRFFEGYSIESYNSACDYAEGLKSSGKISGYEVTPTGTGVQVTCY